MKYVKVAVALAIIAVVGVVIYYVAINNRESENKPEDSSVRKVVVTLSKDLTTTYPVSAREVVEIFTDIQMCYYNESYSEDELIQLATQARMLMDDELISQNPFDEYIDALKKDIDEYKDAKRTISRVIIDKSSEIEYITMEDRKNAMLNCVYYLKENKNTVKVYEKYVLRKDASDKWKIYGFTIVE